jgi:hypothetical protein
VFRHSKRLIFPDFSGAAEGTRTPDPIITNDVLYQLSYSGPCGGGYNTPYLVGKELFSLLWRFGPGCIYRTMKRFLVGQELRVGDVHIIRSRVILHRSDDQWQHL